MLRQPPREELKPSPLLLILLLSTSAGDVSGKSDPPEASPSVHHWLHQKNSVSWLILQSFTGVRQAESALRFRRNKFCPSFCSKNPFVVPHSRLSSEGVLVIRNLVIGVHCRGGEALSLLVRLRLHH